MLNRGKVGAECVRAWEDSDDQVAAAAAAVLDGPDIICCQRPWRAGSCRACASEGHSRSDRTMSYIGHGNVW